MKNRTPAPGRQNRRPSGRNDKFQMVDDEGEFSFGEIALSRANRLRRKQTRLPAFGQLRIPE
jgi:hypothetical protein